MLNIIICCTATLDYNKIVCFGIINKQKGWINTWIWNNGLKSWIKKILNFIWYMPWKYRVKCHYAIYYIQLHCADAV